MTENLEQLVDLVAKNSALKGSFVEELLQTMLSGEFTEVDGDLNPSYEKVIGEMNDLDKALNTLCDRYAKNESQLVDRFRRAETCDEKIESNEWLQMEAELNQTRFHFKTTQNFRWGNIYNRFGQFREPNSIGFGVRSGYQVVLLYGDHNYGIPLELIFATKVL